MVVATLDVFYCEEGQKLRALKQNLSGMIQCTLMPKTTWERTIRQLNLANTKSKCGGALLLCSAVSAGSSCPCSMAGLLCFWVGLMLRKQTGLGLDLEMLLKQDNLSGKENPPKR